MRTRELYLAGVLCVGLSTLVYGQPPAGPAGPAAGGPQAGGAQAGGPQAGGGRAPYVPKNLKVLPANADLRAIMRQYEGALGVECEYCHAPADPVTHRADRASDANPEKDKARAMIRMTDDLNTKYLAQLPWRTDTDVVSCGTCHRGQKHPPAFVPTPRQPGSGPGGPGGGAGAGAPPAPPPA
ncbi:MAG: c-type cytochrome [Acidobacteriaceae bacterium]|jgi:hypothetical protein